MTGLERRAAGALGVPVVDGVAAAVRLAETLAALNLTASRSGSCAETPPKTLHLGQAGVAAG
jgi:allantoin racemase